MTRAERRCGTAPPSDSPQWKTLHRVAVTSLSLWFVDCRARRGAREFLLTILDSVDV